MIDKFMYGKTTVNVIGSLYAEVKLGKKQKTILQHTFMADQSAEEVTVQVTLSTKATLAELRMMAAELARAADIIEAEIKNPTQERLNTRLLDTGETIVVA
jgi:hypothetical protein